MPTLDEKVAQIEVALRHRFFPYVPKIEKQGRSWTDVEHTNNRLSRSLAAYALVKHCGIDDFKAVEAITDGSNDDGIDALYFDRNSKSLVVVQSKFKRIGTAPNLDEAQRTVNGVKALQARRFHELNSALQSLIPDVEEALEEPGVKIDIRMVYLGDQMNIHATQALNRFCDESNDNSEVVRWQPDGVTDIYNALVAERNLGTITDKVFLENWSGVNEPYSAYYGQISALELMQLHNKHGDALFQGNIRFPLGPNSVNTAIEKTVYSNPEELFYLNNGITAIATKIERAPGQPSRCAFMLKEFSIVNGAQTVSAITSASKRSPLSPKAKVFITIIEIKDNSNYLGTRVTRARNYQNDVKEIHFAALDPNQERLRRELASIGITYHYRPSAAAQMPREDAFKLEDAALALACLGFEIQPASAVGRQHRTVNAVDLVVTAKDENERLLQQNGDIYKKLFSTNLSGIRLYRLVQLYRFIDPILAATERSEQIHKRRMFFRHARFFIMAFVASRSEQIVNQASTLLTDDQKDTLSRQVNELSELIYTASEPLQSSKGYRAIFGNLTDSQQLADAVLRRLGERGAQ